MNTKQLGANTACLNNLPLQEAVDHLRRLGLHGIALLAFSGTRNAHGRLAGFWFRELTGAQRQWLKDQLVGFERVALHAPFADLPLFSYDRRVEQLSLERVEESIDAAAYLGAPVVTVHANARSNLPVQDYWEDMVGTLRHLGEYAWDRKVRIGVETGFPLSIDLFVDLLEAVGHYGVGATLDVGHLSRYVDRDLRGTAAGAIQINQRILEMIRQLGPLVLHCHLHDVSLPDWRDHRAIGRGVIDFPTLLAELASVDFQGMLELELEEEDAATVLSESKTRLESMIRRVERARRPRLRRAA